MNLYVDSARKSVALRPRRGARVLVRRRLRRSERLLAPAPTHHLLALAESFQSGARPLVALSDLIASAEPWLDGAPGDLWSSVLDQQSVLGAEIRKTYAAVRRRRLARWPRRVLERLLQAQEQVWLALDVLRSAVAADRREVSALEPLMRATGILSAACGRAHAWLQNRVPRCRCCGSSGAAPVCRRCSLPRLVDCDPLSAPPDRTLEPPVEELREACVAVLEGRVGLACLTAPVEGVRRWLGSLPADGSRGWWADSGIRALHRLERVHTSRSCKAIRSGWHGLVTALGELDKQG